MATCFYASNCIECHQVAEPLCNLQVAIWADPGFGVFCICANAGLNRVFDAPLKLGATDAHPQSVEVEFLDGFCWLLAP